MEDKIYQGFYCEKCRLIPLLQIIPKKNNIFVFSSCQCRKQIQNLETFKKNYYKKNISFERIRHPKSLKQDISKSKYDIINLYQKFSTLKQEFNSYCKDLKDKLISSYNEKIKKITEIYEKYKKINSSIETFISLLFDEYKLLKNNINTIKNVINNTEFNTKYKYVSIDYNSIVSFYQKEFLINCPDNQLQTVTSFYNYYYSEINCFIDYKINGTNEYYGVAPVEIGITLYDLNINQKLLCFDAHSKKINWITKSIDGNIISCSDDFSIKIWPILNDKIIIKLKPESSKKQKVELSPLCEYKSDQKLLKMEILSINKKNYLFANSSYNFYLFDFFIDNNNNDKNYIKLNKIFEGKANINDFVIINRKNYTDNHLVCFHNYKKIFLINVPKFEILKELSGISTSNKNNILVQINENEIMFSSKQKINILTIDKFQIKLSIKTIGYTDCLLKLKDDTLIEAGRYGIKRYLQKTFQELPSLGLSYNDEFDDDYVDYDYGYYANPFESTYLGPETILYMKELLDGRFVICYRHKAIIIYKLKTF